MSTRRLVICITFLAIFAMAARISVDNDTWWHLRAGQWMVEHRTVPLVDPFSYTRAGAPWQYPGWLVEVPMYGIFRTLGPGGLNLWTAIIVTLTFVFVWLTLTGGPFLRAFTIVFAATASGVYWAARPYLVTFLFAAVFLWILEGFRWHKISTANRRLWWLPVLMVIWANSHGGFAVGFILWGVYFVHLIVQWAFQTFQLPALSKSKGSNIRTFKRSDLRVMAFVGFFMVLAVCVNPAGPVMLVYPFKTIGISVLQDYIQEWQSPDFHSLSVQPFAWLLLLTLGVGGASRKRLALTDFLLVTGFAYMGLMAGRNVALFALAAPAVLTRHAVPLLQGWGRFWGFRVAAPSPTRRWQSKVNWFILGILSLVVILKVSLIYPLSVNEDAFNNSLPVEAVEYIRQEEPPGRLFNSYNWGGYLLWALPEYPVFVDGRTDLYSDEILGEWLNIMRADEGWEQVLDQYKVNLVLIETDSILDKVMGIDMEWNQSYQDSIAVVYQRR